MHAEQREVDKQPAASLGEAITTSYPTVPESERWPSTSIEGVTPAIEPRQYPEIADLVKIDDMGRGHITSDKSNGKRHSRLISHDDMGQIVANQELIRKSLPERYSELTSSTQAEPLYDNPVSEPILPSEPAGLPDSNDSPSTEIDLTFMREFDPELAHDIALAINKWSGLVAKRERSSITLGATSAKSVRAAQRRYERLRRESQSWTSQMMKRLDLPESSRIEISRSEELTEAKLLALSIKKDFDKTARPTGKLSKQRQQFYDWWARQGGGDKFFSRQRLTGTAKKMGVMFAVGLPVGVAAGTAGIFIGGPILGAVAATGVSRGVARNLIRGHVDKNTNSKTVSDLQYEKRLAEQTAKINSHYALNQAEPIRLSRVKTVTDIYAEGTAQSVRRNRLRLMGSIATGAVAGLAGAFLGELAHEALVGNIKSHSATRPLVTIPVKPEIQPNSNTSHIQVKTPRPTHAKSLSSSLPKSANHHVLPPRARHHTSIPTLPPPIKPIITSHPQPALHGTTGQEFYVKPEGGEISEIKAYASSHNYSVTPISADQIYQELYAQHGADIIKLDGNGPSTYLIAPGDIGLSHPGLARWCPGIEAELRELLAKDAA